MRREICCCVIFVLLILSAARAQFANNTIVVQQPHYSIQVTGISIASADYGYVTGMNAGAQASYWTTRFGDNFGYLWDGTQNISLPPTTGASAIPTGISNSGIVAGYYGPLTLSSTAAYWDQAGLHSLPGLGGAYTWAEAINNNNVIAGRAENALVNIQRHLVTWNGNTINDLGQLPSFNDEVVSINNFGQILGKGPGDISSWIWQNGQYHPLKDLQGGVYSDVFAMNEASSAVGMSWPDQANERATVWLNGAADPQALPVPSGTGESRAYEINNEGDIVGYYAQTGGSQAQAALWRDGTYYRLNDLIDPGSPWNLVQAWFVNDSGQILALGSASGIGYRELLLTPVPEPNLFAAGIFFLIAPLALRRERRLRRENANDKRA